MYIKCIYSMHRYKKCNKNYFMKNKSIIFVFKITHLKVFSLIDRKYIANKIDHTPNNGCIITYICRSHKTPL